MTSSRPHSGSPTEVGSGPVTDGFDPIRGIAEAASGPAVEDFISRFTAEWLTPLSVGDGYTETELATAEARIGVRVPSALRTAYRLFGCRDDLVRSQDHLMDPSNLRLDDEHGVLVFRTENQNVTSWGVRLDTLHMEDPPVLFRVDDPGTGERGWRRFLDRLSLGCVEMVLSEWMLGGEIDLGDNRELDDSTVIALERGFGRLGLPDYPLWAAPDGPPVRWFGDTDVLLRDDGRQWLWVRAKTREALDRVRRALPGDWIMNGEYQFTNHH